jgi:hypothetical protein
LIAAIDKGAAARDGQVSGPQPAEAAHEVAKNDGNGRVGPRFMATASMTMAWSESRRQRCSRVPVATSAWSMASGGMTAARASQEI